MKTYEGFLGELLTEVSAVQALKNATAAATPNKEQAKKIAARRAARAAKQPSSAARSNANNSTNNSSALAIRKPKQLPPSGSKEPSGGALVKSPKGALKKTGNKFLDDRVEKAKVKVDSPKQNKALPGGKDKKAGKKFDYNMRRDLPTVSPLKKPEKKDPKDRATVDVATGTSLEGPTITKGGVAPK